MLLAVLVDYAPMTRPDVLIRPNTAASGNDRVRKSNRSYSFPPLFLVESLVEPAKTLPAYIIAFFGHEIGG